MSAAMRVRAHTVGIELEKRGKEQCLQGLPQVSSCGPHNNVVLHLSEPPAALTSVSPGDVDGLLLRLPVRYSWASQSSFLWEKD